MRPLRIARGGFHQQLSKSTRQDAVAERSSRREADGGRLWQTVKGVETRLEARRGGQAYRDYKTNKGYGDVHQM